jgi:hypothetical protein
MSLGHKNCHSCQPCMVLPLCCPPPPLLEEVLPARQPPSTVRHEYIPFERKLVEMVEEEVEERIPVTKKVLVSESRKVLDRVPVERKYTDVVKVQVNRKFQAHQVSEDKVQRVPVTKVLKRPVYVPIQT